MRTDTWKHYNSVVHVANLNNTNTYAMYAMKNKSISK